MKSKVFLPPEDGTWVVRHRKDWWVQSCERRKSAGAQSRMPTFRCCNSATIYSLRERLSVRESRAENKPQAFSGPVGKALAALEWSQTSEPTRASSLCADGLSLVASYELQEQPMNLYGGGFKSTRRTVPFIPKSPLLTVLLASTMPNNSPVLTDQVVGGGRVDTGDGQAEPWGELLRQAASREPFEPRELRLALSSAAGFLSLSFAPPFLSFTL
jgi:hypothetical protein